MALHFRSCCICSYFWLVFTGLLFLCHSPYIELLPFAFLWCQFDIDILRIVFLWETLNMHAKQPLWIKDYFICTACRKVWENLLSRRICCLHLTFQVRVKIVSHCRNDSRRAWWASLVMMELHAIWTEALLKAIINRSLK